MSAQAVSKKRKSTGDAASATKKVKTAKSASKPAPLKSALKKSVPKDEVAVKKAKASKPAKAKPANEAEKVVEAVAGAVEDAVPQAESGAIGGADLTENQTAALIAGFSSSEDEASGDETDGVAIDKLPQAPRMAEIQKRIKEATTDDPERTPGVIYVGRIPHGFYEPQMRAYFSQFGTIQNLRLARNRKTGKSQHYAFVEFSSKAVADIVAKTMNKYLLFGHIVQVRTVSQEQVKENMWKGTGKRRKPAPRNRLEGSKLKRGMVREDWDKRVEREAKKRAEKAEKLKELDYDFDMPELKTVSVVLVKAKETEGSENGGAVEADEGVKLMEDKTEAKSPVADVVTPVEANDSAIVEKVQKATKKRPSTEAKTKKSKKVKT